MVQLPTQRLSAAQSRLIIALFGISGATALIYEVAWSRTLQFIFGSTVQSVSTILAGFLVGFAIGSSLFRNLASRTSRLIWHIAIIEILIGVYGLLMPLIAKGLNFICLQLPDLLVIQLALSMIVLIIPSALFGGLWPYIGQLCIPDSSSAGTAAAAVYMVNSMGAALGAFVCGFLLIPAFGLNASSWIAATLNIAAGIILFYLSHGNVRENK